MLLVGMSSHICGISPFEVALVAGYLKSSMSADAEVLSLMASDAVPSHSMDSV